MLLNEKTSLSFSFMQYYFSILRESCQKKPIFKEAYAFYMMYAEEIISITMFGKEKIKLILF